MEAQWRCLRGKDGRPRVFFEYSRDTMKICEGRNTCSFLWFRGEEKEEMVSFSPSLAVKDG